MKAKGGLKMKQFGLTLIGFILFSLSAYAGGGSANCSMRKDCAGGNPALVQCHQAQKQVAAILRPNDRSRTSNGGALREGASTSRRQGE